MSRPHSGQAPPPSSPADHGRRLLIGLAVWFGLFGLARLTARPPGPIPEDGPERSFSAQRAAEVLDRLIEGLDGPHPTGSAAADEVLARIGREVAGIEWPYKVQEAVGTGPNGVVGLMRNLVARRDGTGEVPAVLIAAHYDSVGAGPGIADDLASVAALIEVARALGDSELERTVILLFTDGEEAGLVGAEAFLDDHAWAHDVGVVLNLEARGVSGPSHMFQTGADNAWLVSAWAAEARRPDANSLSVEVYRRMPNDTDFTMFLERGLTGLNFAFIGDWFAYHTPLDDREHLSLSSLQHQGEQVLAAVRALQDDEVRPEAGDAVYATVFGRFVGRTSIRFTRLLALVGALGLLWALHRAVRYGQLTWRRAWAGLLWTPVCLALPAALAFGYVVALRALTGTPSPWHASPSPSWIGLIGGTMLCMSVTGGLGARLATPLGQALSVWVVWGVLGLFTSVFLPGASYLFVWPAFWIALCANGVRLQDAVPARAARIALFTIVAAVPLWSPVLSGLSVAFGMDAAPGVLVAIAVPASLLLPLFGLAPPAARRGVAGLGLACLVFGGVMTVILPHETGERPGRLNLVYAADEESARWQAWAFGAPLPAQLAAAADWQLQKRGQTPRWRGRQCWSAPAPLLAQPLPVFEEVTSTWTGEGDDLLVKGVVRSYALAARTAVEVGKAWEVLEVVVEGRSVGRPGRLGLIAPGQEGLELELLLKPRGDEPGPVELRLVDRVHGLPAEGGFLQDARGATFVPAHDGDGMMLVSQIELAIPDPL